MLPSSPLIRNFHHGLQPTLAWTAILALVIFSILCVLAGGGSILRIVFPIGAFAVGVLLYTKYPTLYLGFTWWMWFLTPLLSRLCDYQSGFDETRLMIISPFLVTSITFATFLRHLPRSYQQGGLAFILAFTGVLYGFLVGLINNPLTAVSQAFLYWLTPILFGFHLFVNWQEYPSYRQNIQRTFLWGVLVMGIYGVLQYLLAPEWDRVWLIGTKLHTFGNPEPLGMRVWSTMNSPGPFAMVMMAGLLLLFNGREALRFPAAGAGYLAFLLSLARTAWIAWFMGFLILIASLKGRTQMRLITTMLVMAVCVYPLTTVAPFSKIIYSRVQTLSNIEEDNSYNGRLEIYAEGLGSALSEGLGKGLGAITKDEVVDSGWLEMLFTLGWFGTIPYMGGIILILLQLLQSSEIRSDSFMSAARAISLSLIATLFIGSTMLAASGVLLWGFLGIAMAAHKYHQR